MNKVELQQHIINLKLRFIPLSIFLVSIFTIVEYLEFETGIPILSTTFWWLAQAFVLYIFFISKKYFYDARQSDLMIFVQWYLLWNLFSITRGIFIAENYWDWKNLVGIGMALVIPIMTYIATNAMIMQAILKYYMKYTLPLFIVVYFFIPKDIYGFYLVPISFLMLFFPALTYRWKLILLAITIFVMTADIGARSTVIKFGVSLLLSLIYYYKLFIPTALFENARKLLFVAPVILFTLAVTDTFNVFNIDDYIRPEYTVIKKSFDGEVIEDDLKADTRSFLYAEVLDTAEKYNSWMIGRSPAKGNDSSLFGEADPTGRGERAGNEVAILNIFTWTGIMGVVLYLMVFYRASYLAINYSNNVFSQILGLFIAFRWMFAWVEDVNYFTLTTVFLWFMIGLCYSKSFRSMTNNEVEYWVRGIFDEKVIVK